MKRFLSIKIKIFLIISVVFTIFLLCALFYNFYESKKQTDEYLKNLNRSTAKIVINNIQSDFYNLDYTKVKITLSTFDNEYFDDIYVLNKEGYIFAQRDSNSISFGKYKYFQNLLSGKETTIHYFSKIKFGKNHIGYLLILNDKTIFDKKISKKKNEAFEIFIISLIIITLLSYILSSIITKPLRELVIKLQKLKDKDKLEFQYEGHDEFALLSKVIEKNRRRIQDLNNNLEKRVQEEIKKSKQKDELIQKQAISSSLGEMIDVIAHQWKQPLSIIQAKSQELYFLSTTQNISENEILESSNFITKQISHLVTTLDDFRKFFRPNKKLENISLLKTINSTLSLLKDDIEKSNIKILNNLDDTVVNIIKNEFKHILINLISNSKDEFNEKNIKNRTIEFDHSENVDFIKFHYKDNAGGIPKNIIDDIFKANFTTKSKGTGIGLYMSKMIIEKINGKIKVKNTKDGAWFIIYIPKNSISL